MDMPRFTADASLLKKGEPHRPFRISHQGTNHEEVVPRCTWIRWCDDEGYCYRTCVYPDVIKAVGVIYSLYAPEYGRRNRKESKS